mgnify:CR=1 FL=1
MHHYYIVTGVDLAKVKSDANDRAMMKGLYTKYGKRNEAEDEGESSCIHHHSHGEECKDREHEYYRKNYGFVDPKQEDSHG